MSVMGQIVVKRKKEFSRAGGMEHSLLCEPTSASLEGRDTVVGVNDHNSPLRVEKA